MIDIRSKRISSGTLLLLCKSFIHFTYIAMIQYKYSD